MSSNINHTINLSNYEEWFILYMDDELNAEEKLAVENFLLLHPHLQEEMDLLLSTKLPADNVVFEGKKDLQAEAMKLNTVDEALLLYLDNELPAAERKAVEKKLVANNDYRLQLSILQQTKVDPTESIPYPNKEELYRRTERVVLFPAWMRIAVAVVILLFATFFLVMNGKDNPAPDGYAANGTKPKQSNSSPKPVVVHPATEAPQQTITAANTQKQPKAAQEKPETKSPVVLPKKQSVQQQPVLNNEPLVAAVSLPKLETIEKAEPIKIDVSKLTEQSAVALNNVVAKSAVTSIIPASYKLVDDPAEPTDGDYKPAKKTPAKGFLRRVSRFIEKRTGIGTVNADNELLVGAVAFKLN